MKRQRVRRVHFSQAHETCIRERSVAMIAAPRIGHFEHISKVFGASPAIVFAPPGPIASIRRVLSVPDTRPMPEPRASITKAARKPNPGWLKFQRMVNDDDDRIRGYDDGECEPQSRGIH